MFHMKVKNQEYLHFFVFRFFQMPTLRSKKLKHIRSKKEYSAESFLPKYKYLPLVMMKSTSKEKNG